MNLKHLNLTVTDVRAASAFLVRYFGLKSTGGNAGMAFLMDEETFVLSLMKAGKGTTVAYPSTFHFGFRAESEAQVDEINQRLHADGFDVAPPERCHAYTFYVEVPGGFTVEVGA